MPDAAGLQADPRFKALPPERQQAILAHISGGGASEPQGLGQQIAGLGRRAEEGYEQDIAQPATHEIEKFGVPKWAAGMIVPQTIPGAALDVASFALPEIKGARIVGEAAGPVARFAANRIGRMGIMGGVGAGTEAATGGSPVSGFAQGAGGEAGAQFLHGAAGQITRRTGLGALKKSTMETFGDTLTKALPWLGKLKTSKDYADNFIHGGAFRKAAPLLQRTKQSIGRQTQGHTFAVPEMTAGGLVVHHVPFDQADQAVTHLQRMAYLPVGDPRSGSGAPDFGALARETRSQIANKLNKIRSGTGDQYLSARRQVDAAITLGGHPSLKRGGVFRHDEIFDQHGNLNQPVMIGRINKYSNDLQRSIGKPHVDNMLNALRRGAKGEISDIPPKSEGGMHAAISPLGGVHAFGKPGRTYKATGKTPWQFQPPIAPFEAATQNLISEMRAHNNSGSRNVGPGIQHLNASRAEHIAPTSSAADRAKKVGSDLSKGRTPNVHRDLSKGRLSMDETNKLVQHSAKDDAMAMLDDVPLTEAFDAVEMAEPQERSVLMPLLKQKLMAELPQQKNQTLASNLSRRFAQLQQQDIA